MLFFLHFMLFPTFLENNNSGNRKIIIIFVRFFLVCLEKHFFLISFQVLCYFQH